MRSMVEGARPNLTLQLGSYHLGLVRLQVLGEARSFACLLPVAVHKSLADPRFLRSSGSLRWIAKRLRLKSPIIHSHHVSGACMAGENVRICASLVLYEDSRLSDIAPKKLCSSGRTISCFVVC